MELVYRVRAYVCHSVFAFYSPLLAAILSVVANKKIEKWENIIIITIIRRRRRLRRHIKETAAVTMKC